MKITKLKTPKGVVIDGADMCDAYLEEFASSGVVPLRVEHDWDVLEVGVNGVTAILKTEPVSYFTKDGLNHTFHKGHHLLEEMEEEFAKLFIYKHTGIRNLYENERKRLMLKWRELLK